jgi:hypothetical protein
VALEGGSARVIEVSPAPATLREPMLFGAPGTATVANGVLTLNDVRGEIGGAAQLVIVLPPRTVVTRAMVNDVPGYVMTRHGDVVQLEVGIAGQDLHQLQPVVAWDSTFTGGGAAGTFTIPRRVFDQLQVRRAAWPIPWTAEDYQTTWLVPERLLLYAAFSEPDDRWNAQLSIDGKPVELHKAYTAVRAVRSTFVGFYADISSLQPDRAYRVELALPVLKPGQFLGLYFENVETEYGSKIALPGRPAP